MKCNEAQQRWQRRWDDGGDDPQLDRHLLDCDRCRRYEREMTSVLSSLDGLQLETDQIVSRDDRSIERPPGSEGLRSWRPVLRSAMGIAAVLALVITASLFFAVSEPTGGGRNGTPGGPIVEEPTPLGLTLRGKAAQRLVAVAQPTSQPNVQVFWLYPTLSDDSVDGPS